MLKTIVAVVALSGTLVATSVEAGTPITIEVTCPLTNARFNFETTASYSTWGRELDGLQMGSWTFPLAIPLCPDSRFPALENLTSEQLTAAAALVQTPGYQAIRDEASYYVLSYVTRELAMGDAIDPAWHLLQATWQVRDQPDLYRRYASELTTSWEASAAAFQAESPQDWMWIESYIANVERQAGRFEEARARLDRLEPLAVEDTDLVERIGLTRRLIAEGNSRPFAPERDF